MWLMEERVGSVKVNECRKGRKRGAGGCWERCRYRVERLSPAPTQPSWLVKGKRCSPPQPLNPLPFVNISLLTLPHPRPLPFSLLPPEPDRQTLRDCGIITFFFPELTLTLWSPHPRPFPQGPPWPRWWPQMQMIPCLETTQSSSIPSCRGSPTSLWSQRRVPLTDSGAFSLNWPFYMYKSMDNHS